MTNYVLIEPAHEGDAAQFWHMLNYDNRFELSEGIPLADKIPPDAAYRMSDEAPDNIALHEILYNLDRQFVVNEKVRSFLEAEGVQHVEYLPVKVLNHKGREVKERYFVVNMLPLVDCIDLSKTQFEHNLLDPEQLMNISNLTVLEEKIPPDFKVLRLKSVSGAMLIRRELAQKMKAAGFRGFSISEISEYRANLDDPMESLDEISGELVTLLNFHIQGAKEASEPLQRLADADAACVYYQAVGICELLLDAEVDAFFHHLIRSAQTRRWVLERGMALNAPPLKLLKASNARGFHAALAARQWELARHIARSSPTTCVEGSEYEDDFLAAHFLHRYVLDAPQEELSSLLDRFEAVLEGGVSPRFDLCRHLLARDTVGCTRAFADLLDERATKLKKMKRESIYATDALFVPQSSIYVEGLAWLALLERAGIHTEAEYPYCPSLARRSKYAPFAVTSFPSVPL